MLAGSGCVAASFAQSSSVRSMRWLVAAPPSQAGGILLVDVLLARGPSAGSVSEVQTSRAEGEAAPNTSWGPQKGEMR